MTGLSTALNSALAGLLVTSEQSVLASRNISRAGDENYTRKTAASISFPDGNVRLSNIARNSEKWLMDAYLTSNSDASSQAALLSSLQNLQATVGDVEADGSVAWSIGQLQNAMRDFEQNPASIAFASQAIRAADTLAQTLSAASTLTQEVRNQADADMATSVNRINTALARIEDANKTITSGFARSSEIAEAMDQRDRYLKDLSAEMGIRVVERPNNAIAVYSDSGVTLFDVSARSVTFQPTQVYSASTGGNAVFADGVQIIGAGSIMPIKSGALAAYASVRDSIATTYQSQLDEIARGLITAFAESDQQAAPSLPDATGLFTYAGSPGVPAAATIVPGIAGQIRLNTAFDPAQGGNVFLLRDGGANGAVYVQNPSGASGFQTRLRGFIDVLDQGTAFSTATGLPGTTSIKSLATLSAGWLENQRSVTDSEAQRREAFRSMSQEALSRRSGVNLDEEMALLLEIERSYQASAKVMNIVDGLFSTLLQSVR